MKYNKIHYNTVYTTVYCYEEMTEMRDNEGNSIQYVVSKHCRTTLQIYNIIFFSIKPFVLYSKKQNCVRVEVS